MMNWAQPSTTNPQQQQPRLAHQRVDHVDRTHTKRWKRLSRLFWRRTGIPGLRGRSKIHRVGAGECLLEEADRSKLLSLRMSLDSASMLPAALAGASLISAFFNTSDWSCVEQRISFEFKFLS
jgi:hypothetical protein